MADVAKGCNEPRIEELVAKYAPEGARIRRAVRIRRFGIASGLLTLVGSTALLVANGLPMQMQGGASFVAAAEPNGEQPDRLASERAEFAETLSRLEQEIHGINSQRDELDAQQASLAQQQVALAKQSELLARFLDEFEMGQASFGPGAGQSARLDAEIAAMAAQREALERRWAQFEEQGELLAMEIRAVRTQREELDLQARQISQQREELSQLLDLADRFYQDSINALNSEPADDAEQWSDDSETLAWNTDAGSIDGENLNEMRGGFSIGDGLDVSFGYTQTGSINGVEQYTNNFRIGSLSAGFQDTDMSNMNSVVLQNGDGNFISSSVLDGLSESFGSVIQNTLDDQVISTTTTFDIELHNVPGTIQGIAGEQAMMDSVGAFR